MCITIGSGTDNDYSRELPFAVGFVLTISGSETDIADYCVHCACRYLHLSCPVNVCALFADLSIFILVEISCLCSMHVSAQVCVQTGDV